MRKTGLFLLALAGIAASLQAGVMVLPADGVIVDNNKWHNIPYVFADDSLYAVDSMLSNPNQHKFRVSLADPAPADTQNTRITNVTLFVKARAHYPRSSEVMCPYFDNVAGIASTPIKFGTTEVTRSYNITTQMTRLPDSTWNWDDIANLSVEYYPKKQGVIYYVNYIYAVVTYVDTVLVPQKHHFQFSAIASPETVGVAFPIAISAHDSLDNPLTSYSGMATLWDSTMSVSPNTVTFANGACSTSVLFSEYTVNNPPMPPFTAFTIDDGDTFGVSNGFQIVNWIHHFGFDAIASPQTAGQPFGVGIAALNFSGDTLTSFTDSAALSDLSGNLTPAQTGTFSNGVWTGNVTVGTTISWDVLSCGYSDAKGTYSGSSNGFEVQPPIGVAITPIAPAAPASFRATVSPNPLHSTADIALQIPHQGRLTVTAYNILGQAVASRDFGTVATGNRTVSWTFEKQLRPGIYFFTFCLDDSCTAVRKVMVVQ